VDLSNRPNQADTALHRAKADNVPIDGSRMVMPLQTPSSRPFAPWRRPTGHRWLAGPPLAVDRWVVCAVLHPADESGRDRWRRCLWPAGRSAWRTRYARCEVFRALTRIGVLWLVQSLEAAGLLKLESV